MTAAVKHDAEKPRMALLPEVALEGVAKVLTFGAHTYSDDNWRNNGGMAWRRYISAAMRHLLAFSRAEESDPESSLPHIDHAICCLLFLSEYQKRGLGTDDRWKFPPVPVTKDAP